MEAQRDTAIRNFVLLRKSRFFLPFRRQQNVCASGLTSGPTQSTISFNQKAANDMEMVSRFVGPVCSEGRNNESY